MAITVDNSFLTKKALDYAELSSLAYAVWDNDTKTLNTEQKDYEKYKDLWIKVSADYTFISYYNDPTTGYSGTIFQNNNTGTYVLANRGTEIGSGFGIPGLSTIINYLVKEKKGVKSAFDHWEKANRSQ